MSDNINLDVILRLAVQGAKGAEGEVESLQNAIDQYSRSGDLSEKQSEKLSRSLSRVGSAASTAEKNLPRLRYALFDVSNSMLVAGAAMTGFATAAYGVNIAMDRAFADVLRTSEIFDTSSAAANNLRGEFEALFTSMPTSWAQLTEIGTLAGQLNIAADSVGEFTQLVAMFAATTDVSIEQSATAFGRLSQLLDVPANELQNLGSSILAVGVNSVATESQIIAISTQITSMAANAGFSADQVFGLSAALASLGTQPELSRGVITRLFTNIGAAINNGGERLEAFGRLAGQTGDEFAKAWGDDASTALYTLMEGLGRVEETKAVQTLNDLGISASRDVPTILRLAQNSDILAESLNVAAQGYADGTALADQYGVITSTVAEKLNILANNFQMLFSKLGEADGLIGLLIDGLIGLVGVFDAIVSNPILGALTGISVALTAIVGVGLLVGSVILRGAGTFYALQTAMALTSGTGLGLSASLRTVTSSMFGFTAATTTATTATRALSVAFRLLPFVGIALTAAALAFEVFNVAGQESSRTLGEVSGLLEAVKQDTAEFADGAQKFAEIEMGTSVSKLGEALGSAKDSVNLWVGAQKQVPPVLGQTDESLKTQTAIVGENAKAWLANALAQDEWGKKLAAIDPNVLNAVGFNADKFMESILKGDGSLDIYLEELKGKINAVIAENPDTGTITAFREFRAVLEMVSDSASNTTSGMIESLRVMEFFGLTASDTAGDLEDYTSALRDAYDGSIDAINGTLDVEDSLFNLGESLIQNGDAWDYFSEAGRANMGSLLSAMDAIANNNSPAVAAAKMQGLFNYIVQGGFASAQQLKVLQDAINALAGGKAVTPIAFNPQSFLGGVSSGYQKVEKAARSASRAAREVREEVRTTADYAKDLSGVFSRAFEIRYDSSSTLDAIADQFQSIRDASEESARSIRTLQAEILGLNSDLNMQEYFLSVAVEYGDDARAQAIRAQIAKTQAEIADKTADLNKEQENNSKVLVGNSEAARRNRAEMEALIKKYQDHVTALAASGLSSDELARRTEILRQDFIKQATQLGYNRNDVMRYAQSFTDLTTVIQKVPRNVTVSANTNPALQALNEFLAKANAAKASPKITPQGGGYGDGWNQGDAYGRGWVDATNRQRNLVSEYNSSVPGGVVYYYWTPGQGGGPKFFAEGGYTGAGGKYQEAGVVHKGEYVIPKRDVNQATGLPYADALGRLTRGQPGRSGYSGGGFVQPSGRREAVDLSAMSIQQLAQVMNKFLVVDGKIVAETATNANEFENAGGAY